MKRNKPYIIGLTGGIASGKSNLDKALSREGVLVIDADKISHGLTRDGGAALPALRARYGDSIFDGDKLNRKRFGDLVFSDKQQLAALNAILHPMIRAEIERQIEENAALPALVIDVPLLYEVGWDSMCDEVWCAWAPPFEQVRRLMRRDEHGLFQAIRRVRAQLPAKEKCRRADYSIDTRGTKENSAAQVIALWRDALRRATGGRQTSV